MNVRVYQNEHLNDKKILPNALFEQTFVEKNIIYEKSTTLH